MGERTWLYTSLVLLGLTACAGAPPTPAMRQTPTSSKLLPASAATRAAEAADAEAAPNGVEFCAQHLALTTKRVTCEMTTSTRLDLAPLVKLAGIEALSIRRAILDRPEDLGSLTSLRELHLVDTALADLSFVKRMPSLRVLDVARSGAVDASPLAQHPALEDVGLGQTKVTDLEPLATLPKLRRLGLSWLRPSSWEPLQRLQELEFLDLSYTEIADLKVIAKLTKLRDLDISSTKVTSVAPLATSTELRRVTMLGMFVDDLTPIARLPNLCRLSAELGSTQEKLLRRHPSICLGGACLGCSP